MKIFDIDPSITVDGWESYYTRIKDGVHVDFESSIRARDGRIIPVDVCANYVYLYGDEYYCVAARDITERKHAEDALRRSEASLAKSQEMAHIGNWEMDVKTCEIDRSAESYRIFGFAPDDVKLNYSQFLECIFPDDREHVDKVIKSTIRTGQPYDILYHIKRSDGETRILESEGEVIRDASGRIIKLFGTNHDVTERKCAEEALQESEERFRATFEQAAVGIAHVALDGRWLRFNQKLCDITGYTREELSKLTFLDITYPNDIETDLKNMERLRSGEIRTYSTEKRYVKKDGSLTWISLTSSLLYKNGKPEYFIGVIEDITERKLNEEKKSFLAAIVESSDDAIISKTLEGIITSWNNAAETMFGYSADEIIGKSKSILIPSDRADELDFILNHAKKGEGIEHYETVRRRKDGTIIEVSISASPIRDESGNIIGASNILRDITDLKRAEEKLRETRDYLESLINYANAPIIVWDTMFSITRFNHAFERFSGYTEAEVVGKDLSILFPIDNREESLDMIKRTLLGEYWESVEIPILHKDGGIRIALWNSANIHGENGALVATIAQGQDITERTNAMEALRTSEANLANAQRISHIGNWVWDTKKDEIRCSNEFYRIFGIEKQEFITYEQFINMINPPDREPVNKAVDAALYMGVPYRIDYRVIWPDASEHIIYAEGEVNIDEAGKPILMFGIVQDITERRLAEIELEKAKAQVEMYNDIMGHDINNMNQVGIGYLEMAIETLGLSDEGKKLLSKPLEALINSSKLIENVRKLQHIKSGDIKHKAMDVNQVLIDIKNSYSNVKDRSIAINYSPVSGCMVAANELLSDVFSNLVGNAIKHSTGMLEVSIGVSSVFENGREYCRAYVEDNGPGISDSIKNILFTRFQRGNTKASGKGLGLFIVNLW